MRVDEAKELILSGIVDSVDFFSNPVYRSHHRNRSGLLLLERNDRARDGWCRFEPAVWFGASLSAGDRKTFSRALRALESQGYIVTERDTRGRIAWVGLTEAGCDSFES